MSSTCLSESIICLGDMDFASRIVFPCNISLFARKQSTPAGRISMASSTLVMPYKQQATSTINNQRTTVSMPHTQQQAECNARSHLLPHHSFSPCHPLPLWQPSPRANLASMISRCRVSVRERLTATQPMGPTRGDKTRTEQKETSGVENKYLTGSFWGLTY